jgi:hypothetical protein
VIVRSYDGVCLLDQAQEVSGVSGRAEVWPCRVLQLSDLAHWGKGMLLVLERKLSHNDVGLAAALLILGVYPGKWDLWI